MSVRSLKVRVLTAAVLWIVIALSVGGYAISQIYNTSALRQLDQRLAEQLDLLSVAVARSPDSPDERMTSPGFARVYSGSYWQAESAPSIVHRSRSLRHDSLELPSDRAGIIDGPRQQSLRVLTRQLTTPNGQDWHLGVAVDLVILEREMQAFRHSLFLAGGILTLVLVGSALLVLRTALAPLAKLRDSLNTDAAEMMPEDFPDEVAPLVSDLKDAFDRNARLREHGRMQAANLAHALKTPAAILRNEIDKARVGDPMDIDVSETAVTQIADAAQSHLSRATARADAIVKCQPHDAVEPLKETIQALRKLFPNHSFELQSPKCLPILIPPNDLLEIVGNLLENAGKFAEKEVRILLLRNHSYADLIVEDDGPGVPTGDLERILQQGVRLDQSVSGSGLGLSIVDDLASRFGGSLTLARSELGGLQATVTIPAAT